MEIYRETSKYYREQLIWGALAALAIVALAIYEVKGMQQGRGSIIGLGYIPLMVGLLVWRYAFRYTYILTDTEFIIETYGLGMKRTYTVDLAKTESFADRYKKSFFRKTGIRQYVHRYSSGDALPTRILVFSENGKKLTAVLFKVSDRFMNELAARMPRQYLRFEENKG